MTTHDPEFIPDYEIRCNNCMRLFKNEDDLADLEDEDGPFMGCPTCKTDEYLMDLIP